MGKRWVQIVVQTQAGLVDAYVAEKDGHALVVSKPLFPTLRKDVDVKLETGAYEDPVGLFWANGGTDRETLKKAVARVCEAVADRLMLEWRGQDANTQ
jgi:hypothetical protein